MFFLLCCCPSLGEEDEFFMVLDLASVCLQICPKFP
jgi:hypothetical protein